MFQNTTFTDAPSTRRGHAWLLFSFLFLATTVTSEAQFLRKRNRSDSTVAPSSDSLLFNSKSQVVPIETYADRFNPRKALLYSAVLPGAGQVYNKKYWKVPLVYGGFAMLIYVMQFNQSGYVRFKGELFQLLYQPSTIVRPNSPTTPGTGTTTPTVSVSGLNEAALRYRIDRFRRDRDFYAMMTGVWYLLQMVDAHVDAHLKEFDLNPKLQVRLEPHLSNSPWVGNQAGMALTIRF